MIAHLSGTALTADIVDVAGVGYAVTCPLPLTEGQPVSLWIHHHRTDSADTLYGFPTTDARDLFAALLRCPGVGGRTACDIIATADLPDVVARLRAGDVTWLVGIKGIGAAKAKKLFASLHVPDHLTAADGAEAPPPEPDGDDLADAVADIAGVSTADAADVLNGLRAAGVTDDSVLLRRATQALLAGARR